MTPTVPRPASPPPVPPPWFPRAGQALDAALDNDVTEAVRLLDLLVAEQGIDCLYDVILSWVDAAIAIVLGEDFSPGDAHISTIVFRHSGDGKRRSVDDVDRYTAWAGRVINARIMDDLPLFLALMNAGQQESGREWGRHIIGLLFVCAETINHGPQDRRGGYIS